MAMFKDAMKSYFAAVTITLGITTAMSIWTNGFGAIIENGTKKVFKQKES